MADEEPVMLGNVLPARVTRTADETARDFNTIGAMAILGEKTRRSHPFQGDPYLSKSKNWGNEVQITDMAQEG
jgi:hypothetical protein